MATTTTYCIAPGCKNNSKVTQGIHYHRIKDDLRWHNFCSLNRTNKFSFKLCERPEITLCSAHFRNSDYENQQDGVLSNNAFPSISTAFEETQEMCYLCFSSSATTKLTTIDPETQKELESINVGLIQVQKIPSKLCDSCSIEISKIVTFVARVKSANDFWRRFGMNVGVVIPQANKSTYEETNTEGSYECPHCESKLSDKDALFRHVWKFHAINPEDPSTCSVCKKKLKAEKYCRSHYMWTHYEGIVHEHLVCSECGFMAKTSKHMTFHLKHKHDIVDEEKIRCEWCTQTFSTMERLVFHMQQRHPEKVIPEPEPEQNVKETKPNAAVFNDDSSHMDVDRDWSDSESNENMLPVKQEKEPEASTSLPLVVEVKKKEKKKYYYKKSSSTQQDVIYKCPECDVEITGKPKMALGGLRRHFWVRHGRIPEKPNKCRDCEKSYESEHFCRQHYFRNHFLGDLTCDTCGKSGLTKDQLSMHKINAHMAREVKQLIPCRFCSRKFETEEKRDEHEVDHEDEKQKRPYVCQECGKCYATEQNYKQHMEKHLGVRYPCPECGLNFVNANVLRVHSFTHLEVAPFSCGLCKKDFNQLGNVKAHILRNHGSFDKDVLDNEIIIRNSTAPQKGSGVGDRRRGGKRRRDREEVIVGNDEYYQEGYEASNSLSSH